MDNKAPIPTRGASSNTAASAARDLLRHNGALIKHVALHKTCTEHRLLEDGVYCYQWCGHGVYGTWKMNRILLPCLSSSANSCPRPHIATRTGQATPLTVTPAAKGVRTSLDISSTLVVGLTRV